MERTIKKSKEVDFRRVIWEELGKIKYGDLCIVIQDNKILQINVDESYDFDVEEADKGMPNKMPSSKNRKTGGRSIDNELIEEILLLAGSIQYGRLSVTVKDKKIVQYEKNERFRV